MQKFLDQAKAALSDRHPQHDKPSEITNHAIHPPTLADVIRYRYSHGANLGSIFVQEKWLTGAFYPPNSTGSSELAAVTAWFHQEGLEKTRDRYQKHWKEYVSDSDLDWLRDVAKCNAVRLPIGFFTLGPAYCNGTAFEEVAFVYRNAW
jgi:aryl-phospho-beta-D-glucosidase BglC (GH1 family)